MLENSSILNHAKCVVFLFYMYNLYYSITILFDLFQDIVRNERLKFNSESFSKIQIMGLLESRVLDFETVIINAVPKFDLTLSTTGATCGSNIGSVLVQVGSGYTGVLDYVLSNGQQILNYPNTAYTFNNLSVGTYNVTVTDADGCSIIDYFNITGSTGVQFVLTPTSCVYGNDGIITTIVLPSNSGRCATWWAAQSAAPDDKPAKIPSWVPARRAYLTPSSACASKISS